MRSATASWRWNCNGDAMLPAFGCQKRLTHARRAGLPSIKPLAKTCVYGITSPLMAWNSSNTAGSSTSIAAKPPENRALKGFTAPWHCLICSRISPPKIGYAFVNCMPSRFGSCSITKRMRVKNRRSYIPCRPWAKTAWPCWKVALRMI